MPCEPRSRRLASCAWLAALCAVSLSRGAGAFPYVKKLEGFEGAKPEAVARLSNLDRLAKDRWDAKNISDADIERINRKPEGAFDFPKCAESKGNKKHGSRTFYSEAPFLPAAVGAVAVGFGDMIISTAYTNNPICGPPPFLPPCMINVKWTFQNGEAEDLDTMSMDVFDVEVAILMIADLGVSSLFNCGKVFIHVVFPAYYITVALLMYQFPIGNLQAASPRYIGEVYMETTSGDCFAGKCEAWDYANGMGLVAGSVEMTAKSGKLWLGEGDSIHHATMTIMNGDAKVCTDSSSVKAAAIEVGRQANGGGDAVIFGSNVGSYYLEGYSGDVYADCSHQALRGYDDDGPTTKRGSCGGTTNVFAVAASDAKIVNEACPTFCQWAAQDPNICN